MKKRRNAPRKKSFLIPCLLLIADLALLIVIISSCASERATQSAAFVSQTQITTESTATPTRAQEVVATQITEESTVVPVQTTETAVAAQIADASTTAPVQTTEGAVEAVEPPTAADFADWYIEDAMWKGMPQGVERITDFSRITGSWKGMIYYDPQSLHGREAIEMLNFTVGGTETALTLTADLQSIYYVSEGESFSETDTEDIVFAGSWKDGGISAEGAATVHITDFYMLNEKQCAIGEMKCTDGLYAKVAMVRP